MLQHQKAATGATKTTVTALVRLALAVALAATALVLGTGVSASAHTDLLQASPGPGQRVGGSVDFIDLVFFESVSDFVLFLEDPSGDTIDGTVTVSEGQIIRYEMPALEAPGRYIARFEMTSADGDFTQSGFFFDYEPDAIQPVPLGDADVPDNTATIVSVVASVVFAMCVIGLVFILLQRLEQKRAAASGPSVDQAGDRLQDRADERAGDRADDVVD